MRQYLCHKICAVIVDKRDRGQRGFLALFASDKLRALIDRAQTLATYTESVVDKPTAQKQGNLRRLLVLAVLGN